MGELWLLHQLSKKGFNADFKKDHVKPDTEFMVTEWSSVFYLTFLTFTKVVTLHAYVYYEIPLLSFSPLNLKNLKKQ